MNASAEGALSPCDPLPGRQASRRRLFPSVAAPGTKAGAFRLRWGSDPEVSRELRLLDAIPGR